MRDVDGIVDDQDAVAVQGFESLLQMARGQLLGLELGRGQSDACLRGRPGNCIRRGGCRSRLRG